MRTLLLLNYLLLPSWRAQYVSAHRHQPLPNTDTGDTDVDLESVRHHRNNNNTRHLHTTTTITSMPRRFAVLLPRFLTDEDRNTLAAALLLGPTLFACNWAYYSGLARTTVASSSTIGATASLFALVFALRCPTPTRAAACVLGVVGVVMIFYHDLSGDGSANIGRSSVNLWRYSDNGGGMINSRKAMGDMLSLVSAACSGLYSVIIKNTFVTWCCAPTTTKRSTSPSSSSLARSATKHTPTPNPIHHHHDNNPHTDYHDTNNLPASSGSEMKLVAFIGVAMVLSGAGPLWVFGHTPPDMKTVGLLMTNALLGEVIPSTIWIRAAKHMSPVVTAMAGAVMVPMSVVADVVMDKPGKKEMLALTFVGGTVLVVGSFVVLAAADVWEKKEEEEDEGEEESVGEDNDDDGER